MTNSRFAVWSALLQNGLYQVRLYHAMSIPVFSIAAHLRRPPIRPKSRVGMQNQILGLVPEMTFPPQTHGCRAIPPFSEFSWKVNTKTHFL